MERVEKAPGFRFSLHALLAAVLVVAVGVRAGQWLRASISEHGISADWLVTMAAVSFALPAILAWPAVLSARSPWARVAALLVATPAFAMIVPYLSSAADELKSLALWVLLQTLLVAFSLAVVRGAGFRWVRARQPLWRRLFKLKPRSIGARRLNRELVEPSFDARNFRRGIPTERT